MNLLKRVEHTDLGRWFQAAIATPPAPPSGVEAIRSAVRQKNPVRWARLQREFRWMQRRMKKMGLNPEDARWIL